jgi:hypothetical protein
VATLTFAYRCSEQLANILFGKKLRFGVTPSTLPCHGGAGQDWGNHGVEYAPKAQSAVEKNAAEKA